MLYTIWGNILLSDCTVIWAVRFRIGSRLAPDQAWPVCFSLHRFLCEAIVWSLAALGKGERQWRCPELSLWVLISMLSTRLLGFFLSTSGFSDWPVPGAGGYVYNLFHPRGLRRRPEYVQFCFRFFVFLNWSFDSIHGDPRRLPSVRLEWGRYDVTSP